MFKDTKIKTPKEYIASISDKNRQADIKRVDSMIKKLAPKSKPFMLAGMLAYGKFAYRSKSGRQGDWALLLLANQKNYISFYVCALDKNDQYVAEKYKKTLPKANIGRSCVRFKRLGDLDEKILAKLITEATKSKRLGVTS